MPNVALLKYMDCVLDFKIRIYLHIQVVIKSYKYVFHFRIVKKNHPVSYLVIRRSLKLVENLWKNLIMMFKYNLNHLYLLLFVSQIRVLLVLKTTIYYANFNYGLKYNLFFFFFFVFTKKKTHTL